jgi:hypothetical protein
MSRKLSPMRSPDLSLYSMIPPIGDSNSVRKDRSTYNSLSGCRERMYRQYRSKYSSVQQGVTKRSLMSVLDMIILFARFVSAAFPASIRIGMHKVQVLHTYRYMHEPDRRHPCSRYLSYSSGDISFVRIAAMASRVGR